MPFRLSVLLIMVMSLAATGQPLSGANFRYWYDALHEATFRMAVVNTGERIEIHYRCDTSRFDIRWERRDSYSQRMGDPLSDGDLDPAGQVLTFPLPSKPWLLVAALTSKADNESFWYFQVIEDNYPVDCLIRGTNGVEMRSYLRLNTPYTFLGRAPELKVYRYQSPFPAATSPFSEMGKAVDPVLEPDSTFYIKNNGEVAFKEEGLYLVQADTNAARGVAFRVVNGSYPKLSQLSDLSAALVFICTREEFDKLRQAGTDKVKFDRVILDITRDKDRAKNVIRKYFRRVEMANIFFGSFKEGWKTDRGMIYVIYGPPDEVQRTNSLEIWNYHGGKSKFVFERTPTIYDPDHFVLQRDKKFMESWYLTVDMWRKNQVASAEEN
jgi:GWxTD domain-containing protein